MSARRLIAFAGVAALAACGPARREFRPESADAETALGYAAAQYELKTDRGHWGETRVWSEGVLERPEGQNVVHVGFRIFNDTAEPLRLNLERTQLQIVRANNDNLTLTEPARTADDVTIPPDGDLRVRLRFPLNDEIRPRSVKAYRVIWSVERGQRSYTQATTFVRDEETGRGRYYDPAYGYYPSRAAHDPVYDPYFGPYWGAPNRANVRFGVGFSLD